MGVVALENRLPQQEEVIIVLHHHQDASAPVVLNIPHIVERVDLEPVLVDHEEDGLHLSHLETVYKSDPLLCKEHLFT